MAGGAIIDDAAMIENGVRKCAGDMTHIAVLAGDDMVCG